MSTTQKRQKTLNNTCSVNLNFTKGSNSRIKWSDLIYVGCLFITLIVGSLSSSAQFLPITPVSSTNLTPLSSTSCHIDDWTALKALYESTNGDNWKRHDGGWDVMIGGYDTPPQNCNLSDLDGIVTNNFGRVRVVSRTNNNLMGSLPTELGLLKYLDRLFLGTNNLSGTIPNSLTSLNNLEILRLSDNNLIGDIPDFQNVYMINISGNRFACDEINQFLDSTNASHINFSPQYFEHSSEPFIVDTNQVNNFNFSFSFKENPFLFGGHKDGNYKWVKNGDDSQFFMPAHTISLSFNNVQPSNAGIYEIYLKSPCLPNLMFISEPLYVIYPGYDFEGQPVESNQIMVEFEDQEITEFYEDLILFPNAGLMIDRCNCNRELYLWQFPSTEDALAALTEINGKNQNDTASEDDIDGGFNNTVNRVADTDGSLQAAYYLPAPSPGNYPGAVNLFILDTGVDDAASCLDTSYLLDDAPVDFCYAGSASGYDYLEQNGPNGNYVNINYQDDQGHGTFGYHTMSSGFTYANNINIVPLKVFDNMGKGNLFDLTCALYHAIDHGAHLVNISAGYQGQLSTIFENAINTAREEEVFICTSAGNNGINIDTLPQYPASFAGLYHYEYNDDGEAIDSTRYANVISVASQKGKEQFADNTNFGPKSVTLSCLGEDLAGVELDCNNVIGSGTSFATFVVSRYLALEIAKDNNRTFEQIWNAFEAELSWDGIGADNSNQKTITGKRVNLNLNKQLQFMLGKGKIAYNSSIETQLVETSLEVATLNYKVPENGVMQVNLYDASGRFIRHLLNEDIDKGNHQLPISKDTFKSGIYFIQVGYLSEKGLIEYNVLKLPVLQ